jgi:hypothetical protein
MFTVLSVNLECIHANRNLEGNIKTPLPPSFPKLFGGDSNYTTIYSFSFTQLTIGNWGYFSCV